MSNASRPISPSEAAPRPRPKPGILDIEPYVGGKSTIAGVPHPLKLSSNENVLGAGERAKAAYLDAVGQLSLYPDGQSNGLRAAVAKGFNLEPERLIFGCGSDEIFTLLAQVYCEPGDNIVQGQYGFLAYRIAARSAGADVRFAKEPHLRVEVDALLAEVDDRTRIVFLANPANPTGTWLIKSEVRRLHTELPSSVILVLDGAYAEFADTCDYDDGLDLAARSSNIVVTRTFSKIHGLASLRVGWGYAPLEMIDAMERIRSPFNINGPAQAAAVAALGDAAFLERSKALVETWRPWLSQQLGGLGLETTPSAANFVLARFPKAKGRTASDAEAFLASKGILVRGLGNYGLPDAIRLTVGLEEHNRRVIDALTEFLID